MFFFVSLCVRYIPVYCFRFSFFRSRHLLPSPALPSETSFFFISFVRVFDFFARIPTFHMRSNISLERFVLIGFCVGLCMCMCVCDMVIRTNLWLISLTIQWVHCCAISITCPNHYECLLAGLFVGWYDANTEFNRVLSFSFFSRFFVTINLFFIIFSFTSYLAYSPVQTHLVFVKLFWLYFNQLCHKYTMN